MTIPAIKRRSHDGHKVKRLSRDEVYCLDCTETVDVQEPLEVPSNRHGRTTWDSKAMRQGALAL